jgi:hypothetical protein
VRWVRRLVLLALAVAFGWDLSRPPARQWSAAAALAGIRIYQTSLSPHLGHAGLQCRFSPSCSRYAEAVIRRDGMLKGGWRTIVRIARCGPWTPMGTVEQP